MPEIRCGVPESDGACLDVLVVGGGIIGAGVFRRCARQGYRVLLVDQGDFASGTSSRSSKLVHGGLHYLTHFQVRLARRACRDRDRLLRTAPGLVRALEISLPPGSIGRMPRWVGQAFLATYAHLGGGGVEAPSAASGSAPHPTGRVPHPDGGLNYTEAVTDDAGLVLRVLREGCRAGGHARNYVRLDSLILDGDGFVRGARLSDRRNGRQWGVLARTVVNATGIWADQIRGHIGMPPRLRFIRGSHLVIPWDRLPLMGAVAGIHPATGRPAYCVPWQGTTLVGSTSVPHDDPIDQEPTIQAREADYLLKWVQGLFAECGIGTQDVCATFSGLRAVVDSDSDRGIDASREPIVQEEDGLITVAGGKLTIFPSLAREVTDLIGRRMPAGIRRIGGNMGLDPLPDLPEDLPLPAGEARRILARYGEDALDRIARAPGNERRRLPGLPVSAAELRWSARSETPVHLDDLLLRRVRIGLTHPGATRQNLGRLSGICSRELGWSRRRRRAEELRFLRQVSRAHAMPGRAMAPQKRALHRAVAD
jgi:glycerol-3-phosphate dehydrogenase